jgi:hypothetical protein
MEISGRSRESGKIRVLSVSSVFSVVQFSSTLWCFYEIHGVKKEKTA